MDNHLPFALKCFAGSWLRGLLAAGANFDAVISIGFSMLHEATKAKARSVHAST